VVDDEPTLSRDLQNAPTRGFVTLCDPITTVTRLRSVTIFGLGCPKLVTIRSIGLHVSHTRLTMTDTRPKIESPK
jgi:hypothetical protein